MKIRPAEIDYENILEPQMLDFLKRTEDLEGLNIMETSQIQMKELDWDSNTSEMKRNIRMLKVQMKDLKDQMQKNKEDFIKLVDIFRNKANREDFQKVSRIADDLKLEEYMTREEFFRRLQKL
ncbi:MAG: hypothetical protein ABIJ34_08805 [archaeon]